MALLFGLWLLTRLNPWRVLMSRIRILSVLFFCLALFLSGFAYGAETMANIIGTVTDEDNSPLPGVTITAVNNATNFTRVTVSENNGVYRVALLPSGTYTITVELGGFGKQIHKNIVLTIGKEIVLDFQMKVAKAEEQLEVVGETPLIDATKSALQTTVDQNAIKSLPLNGRDYTQLSLLAPGVKPVTLTNYGQFQIGGQRGDAVNYTIDGGENNFSYTNEARTLFTQEGVKEFQILTNRFSAEYGRSTSGVINVISKSGTNEFHGNGFFFFRGDQFDSQDFFARQSGVKAPFDQQQGGGTLGGPIVRDKTFFFFAYEQTNTDKTLSVAVTPSTPNGLRPKPIDLKLLTAKMDHTINEQHSMVFRYNLQDRKEAGFYAGGRYVDTVLQNIKSQTVAASETAVLSSNTYNEALVQYGRFLRTDIPEVQTHPWEFRPSSVTGWYYCCPQRFLENRVELLDTYTHVFSKHGEHTMKAGVDYIHVGSDLTFAQYIGGGYFFATDDPFDPNNAETFPTFFELGVGNPTTQASNHQFSVFVQDDWRVNDRLTLNLGLRYDIEKYNGDEVPTPLTGTGIVLGKIPGVDKNNFGPRLGFTYDLGGKGETILRGGYGRYYKPILHNVYNNALLFDGERYLILTISDPNLLAQFFPAIPDPSVLEATPGDVRPMASADLAFSDQASIGFQQELQKDFVVSADYVYVRGDNLTRERNLNAPRNLANPEEPLFPQYGRLRLLSTDGRSWYHALQIGVQKRYSRNLMFTTSYTLSKAEDEASDFYSVAEPNDQSNPDAEKGPGPHDQRHVFAFSAIYDLPAQFQIGTIVRASTGIPINFVLSDDHNSDGFINDRPDLGSNGQFLPPPADRPGNLPRNFGRGGSFFSVDLRVAKNINWKNNRLELIAEVFNLFNRDNFNFRGATVNRFIDFSDPNSLATLGQATEAFDPRQIQFGIKFDF
jgi:outer membrane receptor protein involved in Fe transport